MRRHAPWIAAVSVLALFLGGAIWRNRALQSDLLKAQRGQSEAESRLRSINRAIDSLDQAARAKAADEERITQEELRILAPKVLAVGSKRSRTGVTIVDSRRVGPGGNWVFLVRTNATDVNGQYAGYPSSLESVVVKDGVPTEYFRPQEVFWWASLDSEQLASAYARDQDSDSAWITESVEVAGPGSLSAVVRSMQTAERFRLKVDDYRLFDWQRQP